MAWDQIAQNKEGIGTDHLTIEIQQKKGLKKKG